MRNFRVWAPKATTVTLAIGDGDIPMSRDTTEGWWSTKVDRGCDEVDYAFSLDGGAPRPDPRSLRQPYGVHERSRTFDLAAYPWRDGTWTGRQLAGAVIYELHIGSFTPDGTLDSAIDMLDHLVDLGIDFVELLPVNAFNGHHNWGYDGVLWFAVHEPYGGPPGYQRFVDACHQLGLGVIQDVVYNHLGPSGNYLAEFGPYLHADKTNTWGATVNLDGPGSDEVRRYILDNARMWFSDYHVDGLRLDAVHAMTDSRATPLLEQLATDTDALSAHLGRPLTLIAESDLNDPRLYAPRAAGGYGLGAAWNDDFHHAVHVAVTGESSGYYADFSLLSALTKVLTSGYFHDGSYSSFRGRHHGRPIDTRTTESWRLVASIQTHDQIGNRAAGDRLAALAGRDGQAIAAVLLLTSPFTPMLFMGEEWAASTPWQFFTSHPEDDLGEKTRLGRLEEFARHQWAAETVPDPQNPDTFARSKLIWNELNSPRHAAMLALYRRLLNLRRTRPELTDPRWNAASVAYDQHAHWLTVKRGCLVIAVNFGSVSQNIPLSFQTEATPDSAADVANTTAPKIIGPNILLGTTEGVELADGGRSVSLPPRSAAVIESCARNLVGKQAQT